jgi:WD40 repeat protein
MCQLRSCLSALKPTRLAVLFAVLIGLGVGFWQWRQPPQPRVVLENVGLHAQGHFSPDGQTLAIVHAEPYSLTLWNIQSGQRIENRIESDGTWALAFSPQGRTVACRFSTEIRVWDVTSGNELAVYDDSHGERHSQLTFSPEGKLLSVRQNHVLWDVDANQIVKKLALDGEREIFAWDKEILVLQGKNKSVRIWHLPTASLVAETKIPGHDKDSLVCAKLSQDHSLLPYVILRENAFCVVNLITGETRKIAVERMAQEMAISPDAQTIAVADIDPPNPPQQSSWWTRFTQWLGIRGEPSFYVTLKTFPSADEIVVLKDCRSPVFSPDGKMLAVNGMLDGSLQLWDLPIRKPIGKILGLAGLAAVATLLAFNGLGWLRRRKNKSTVMP